MSTPPSVAGLRYAGSQMSSAKASMANGDDRKKRKKSVWLWRRAAPTMKQMASENVSRPRTWDKR